MAILDSAINGIRLTTNAEARRRAKIADRENRIRVRETDNAVKPKAEAPYRLIHADIANVAEIPDGSLTAIITDPPYPKEFASCYTKLADFAARKLADGGNLVVMTGQANLPEFLERLKQPSLRYVWTLCWVTPLASTQVFGRKIKSNWKPVLWFVKGKNRNEHMRDMVTATPTAGADNRFHRWGQDLDGFIDLIGRFTVKGDLVCDPFCGGGTTGAACIASGRLFIGIDIETESVAATEKRLRAATEEQAAVDQDRMAA